MLREQETATWMEMAEQELGGARRILQADPPLTWMCVFHTQQAAEKALKAFLIYHARTFRFLHDLEYLLGLCCEVEPELQELEKAATVLTPYAVTFRYPPTHPPDVATAEEAIEHAEKVLTAIRRRLDL